EERLNLGYKLLKKHGFQETKQLVVLHAELSGRLGNIEELDDKIRLLIQQVATAEQEMKNLGARISEGRKKQLPVIEKQVNQLLVRVGMPNARLKVQIETVEPGTTGMDAIDFLFDANKSNQFASIRKVASGGELSRLMLCIKSLIAKKVNLPTMIF
ncbi:DNA repair protein RecN, partial [Flavihumibacter sediminis]|nr:DNA repair protein RecN [Flavihumibacter sediminis]